MPMPSGHTMSRLDVRREPNRVVARAFRSASRRAVRATDEPIPGKRVPRRGRSPDHPTEPSAVRLPGGCSTVPRMDDLFEPYQRTRARVSALFLDATPDALTRTVPACPAWTVHDLAAHLAGVPATLAAGSLPSGDVNAWLQGIVDERRGVDVGDLMQEWNAQDATIEPMLQGMGSLMFTDVTIHEHDLRGALGFARSRCARGRPGHGVRSAVVLRSRCRTRRSVRSSLSMTAARGAVTTPTPGWTLHVDAVGSDARARQPSHRRRVARTPRRWWRRALPRGDRRPPPAPGAFARRVTAQPDSVHSSPPARWRR